MDQSLDSLGPDQLAALAEWITNGGKHFVLAYAKLDHFVPDKPLHEYDLTDLLFGRPHTGETFYEDRFLAFGHTPTRLLQKQKGAAPLERIYRQGTQIAIDCGCGGPLGCLCLDTMEKFYV